MKLLAALGNPGEKYINTRHNAGFMIIDRFAQKLGVSFLNEPKFKALMCKTVYNGENLMIIKPQTFMNLSGEAVIAVMQFFKIDVSDLFVIYDDISIALGKIRLRGNGSDGGHNGIKSIINCVHSNQFGRLKFGIGLQPENVPSEVFVLNNFPKSDKELLDNTIETAVNAIECYLTEGLDKAQNKFN